MLKDTRIDTVIPAVDVERARKFYGGTLALEEITPREMDREMTMANAMFRVGDCSRLLVYKRPGPSKAEHTLATFTVDDLEGTMDELRDRGVRFERYDLPNLKTDERGIAKQDGMKAAWFKDSEGNILAIGEIPSLQ